MDLSNEDILELINRLLERLHQTGEDKESNHITFNYVAPGAQYVNRIDTQIFGADKSQKPKPASSSTTSARRPTSRRMPCSGRPSRCILRAKAS